MHCVGTGCKSTSNSRSNSMSFTVKQAGAACAFAALAMIGVDASAAKIKVTCEVRPTRSTISVDGKGLAAGEYTSVAVSGGNMASTQPEAAVAGEVETDYSSRPADINAGATAIVPTFIVGASVTGKIVDASGHTVIADTVACRVRNK
jgi:hypothetical protein